MASKKRAEINYWLYQYKHESIESLLPHIANICKYRKMNLVLFSSKSDILDALGYLPKEFNIRITNSEPIFSISLTQEKHEPGLNLVRNVKAVCVKLSSYLYMLLSDCKPAHFRSMVLRVIRINYPLLSRVFLRNSEIYEIVTKFNKKERLNTTVNRALFYSRVSDRDRYFQEKDLKWTKRSFDELYQFVAEQNGWIRKFDFISTKTKMSSVSNQLVEIRFVEGSISSDCHFIFKGDFMSFYEYFLSPSIKTVTHHFGYLQNRSEKAGEKLPEPIVIKFPEPIFEDEDWSNKFTGIMEKMKNLSVTELHSNPYLHISVLDYRDGSSFTIWIISHDEINIIPQIRASIASMTRIIAHIYEQLREGEMIGYIKANADT